MATGTLVTGAISTSVYIGASVFSGRTPSWSGLAASFAMGAFFGAVGSVTGLIGGSLAESLTGEAEGVAAKVITSILDASSAGVADLVRGESNPLLFMFDMGLAGTASAIFEDLTPSSFSEFTNEGSVADAFPTWGALAKSVAEEAIVESGISAAASSFFFPGSVPTIVPAFGSVIP